MDGDGRGKRVRSQLSSPARQHLRVPVHGVRRHRQVVRLGCKRAALASQAELALHLFVMRPEAVVGDGPVRPNTLGRVSAKIGGMEPRRDSQPRQRASADDDPGLRDHAVFSRLAPAVPSI